MNYPEVITNVTFDSAKFFHHSCIAKICCWIDPYGIKFNAAQNTVPYRDSNHPAGRFYDVL